MISIIVPCYNQAKYMREALDSVLASTLSDWECIIVNDGSKDATIDIAREYEAKDSRFIVVDIQISRTGSCSSRKTSRDKGGLL